MDCQNFEELWGAYALDAITDQERQDAEQHLAGCSACRRKLQELQEVVNLLPLAVPAVAPSPRLKARVFASILEEAPEQMLTQVPRSPRRRSWWQHWETRLVATAAALLLLLVGGLTMWNLSLQQQLAQIAAASPTITYTVSGTGSTATNIKGQVISFPRLHMTTLVVRGLPPTSGTQVYQGWLIKNDKPSSIGLLNFQNGTATLNLADDIDGYDAIAVSLEPGPQASPNTPNGPVVALGSLKQPI
jgi:anti-sigma-K factor RskA